MSDLDRLKQILAKLAARERAIGTKRTLGGATADARLEAVLTEVSETILPRRLSFSSEDGVVLHIGVANRRLQGVLGPTSEGLAPFEAKPLSDPDAPEMQDLKAALLSALSVDAPLTIGSAHLGKDDLGSDAGLSAEALRKAWALTAGPAAGGSPHEALSRFLTGLSGEGIAWLKVEGEEVSEQMGTDDALERLGETAAYVLDAYLNKKDAVFAEASGPRALAIAGADRSVLFTDVGGQSAFVSVPPAHLAATLTAWRASFG